MRDRGDRSRLSLGSGRTNSSRSSISRFRGRSRGSNNRLIESNNRLIESNNRLIESNNRLIESNNRLIESNIRVDRSVDRMRIVNREVIIMKRE